MAPGPAASSRARRGPAPCAQAGDGIYLEPTEAGALGARFPAQVHREEPAHGELLHAQLHHPAPSREEPHGRRTRIPGASQALRSGPREGARGRKARHGGHRRGAQAAGTKERPSGPPRRGPRDPSSSTSSCSCRPARTRQPRPAPPISTTSNQCPPPCPTRLHNRQSTPAAPGIPSSSRQEKTSPKQPRPSPAPCYYRQSAPAATPGHAHFVSTTTN